MTVRAKGSGEHVRPAPALASMTATEGAALVRRGELRPSEWLAACLEQQLVWESRVLAWAQLDRDRVLAEARALDSTAWPDLLPAPRLAGVPFGIKDVFNTRDLTTAMGSDLWSGFEPGNDARVISVIRLLGGQVVGKTVTAEFAVHAPGSTRNPCDPGRIAGTSSTGSAVAVATGSVPVALGTQTAGSIIRPASYVGTLGFKPSFGLIPRTGVLKTSDTLDSIGWFARSVDDLALVFDALRVQGRDYPNVERGLARAEAKRRAGSSAPWRVALAIPPAWDLADPYARDAVRSFAAELGRRPDVRMEELDLRAALGDAHAVHRTIYHKSLSYYFKKELSRDGEVSPILREICAEGREIPLEAFARALERQRELERRLSLEMEGHDVLVTLSVAGEPPPLERPDERDDSALVWTLCGAPAVSLPLFRGPRGLPFGLQVVASRYGDHKLLEFARTILPGALPPLAPPGT